MSGKERQSSWREFSGSLIVALIALMAVSLTIDAAGDYPGLFEGPGVTLDESFNVQMGVYQWNAIRNALDIVLLLPESLNDIFGPESNYNPDHPPLGRVWLGFWHDLTSWLFPLTDHPSVFVTDCARFGSAIAFALTVFLIGAIATKWYGRVGGIVAALSLVLMPRLFGHAHLASLETFLNGTYSLAILSVVHLWSFDCRGTKSAEGLSRSVSSVPVRIAVLTGVLFGLVLLSKIQDNKLLHQNQ